MLKYNIKSRQGTKNLQIIIKLPNGIKRISAKTHNRKNVKIKAEEIITDIANQFNDTIQKLNSNDRVDRRQPATLKGKTLTMRMGMLGDLPD